MRFKESLCRSRLHQNVNRLRGLTVVLAVVMIISAMSSSNVMDDDNKSCSGTAAASIVAAATEHNASSPEDQLLFLKVRRDSVADVSSLTIVVFSTAARHHPLTNLYHCCYRTRPDRNKKLVICIVCWKTKTTYPSDTLPEGTRAAVSSFVWEDSSSFKQLPEDK